MSKKTDKTFEAELDEMFALASQDQTGPSASLMERVLSDAYQVQDSLAPAPVAVGPAGKARAGFADFLGAFGGWRSVSGLATAVAAGVWLGYAPPAMLDDLASGIWSGAAGYELGDFMVSGDSFLVEG